jgi:MarR family 2-MHQ and catechol resistance regulon transcriptional repressor
MIGSMPRTRRTRLIDDERITTFGLLHEAHGRLSGAFDRSFRRLGISGPIYEVLLRVGRSRDGVVRMTDLARQLTVTTGGATRLVDRAVAAGLVERQPCPTDRRVQWVALTSAGEEMLRRATRLHLEDLAAEMAARLTPDEEATLRRTLHKLSRPPREPARST